MRYNPSPKEHLVELTPTFIILDKQGSASTNISLGETTVFKQSLYTTATGQRAATKLTCQINLDHQNDIPALERQPTTDMRQKYPSTRNTAVSRTPPKRPAHHFTCYLSD
jgi:hypothetical protein